MAPQNRYLSVFEIVLISEEEAYERRKAGRGCGLQVRGVYAISMGDWEVLDLKRNACVSHYYPGTDQVRLLLYLDIEIPVV